MDKVSIIHGWSDDNKGDSAIMIGMIDYLNKVYKVNSISIISYYKNCESASYDLIKHMKENEIGFTGIYPRIDCDSNSKYKLVRIIVYIYDLLRKLLILLSPSIFKFLLSENELKSLNEIKSSSYVVSKGGHIFNSHSLSENLVLFNLAFYVFLSKRLKKKVYIFSQSYGPFNNIIAKKIFLMVIKCSESLQCREYKSIEDLKEEYPKYCEKFIYFPDFAFNIPISETSNSKHAVEKYGLENAVGITVRQHSFKKNTEEEYLKTMVKIIESLANRGEKVVIIPHVIGPNNKEDDRIISSKLYNIIAKDNKHLIKSVTLMDNTLNAKELAYCYSKLKLMIGTRFHSVILSLLGTTPSFAISYNGPKAYIMDTFKMKDFMESIENINEHNLTDILQKINYILDNRLELQNKIVKALETNNQYFKNK